MSGKSTNITIRVWYNEEQDDIRIATTDGPELITTINREAGNARGHPHLFNKLAEHLRAAGLPAPRVMSDA